MSGKFGEILKKEMELYCKEVPKKESRKQMTHAEHLLRLSAMKPIEMKMIKGS